MPWPKKKYYMGCCVFCRQEYKLIQFHQGFKLCRCPGAVAEQKRRKNDHNREWHRRKQEAKGKVVVARQKPSEAAKRREVTKVYIKGQRTHRCRICGAEMINRFNCSTCLGRLDNTYDLSIAVEGGYTRHLGARLGG